ncbi:hypothetical protein PG989_014877 [Apiospora arundinis]
MAWVQPAAAPSPYAVPYYLPGNPRPYYYVPGQWGYGPNGQVSGNMVVPIGQPQQVVYHQQGYGAYCPSPNININVAAPLNVPNLVPVNMAAAPAAFQWPMNVVWQAAAATPATYAASSLDVPLYGRRPEDYYPYPPRLPAHRDGSVPGLEYIPVLRDGWADYNSRTNHAVAPPVCDKC